ncbi:head GIN domain-containing protein [Niabella sp.]|uniref:head GIN domain-containing protein n=1 Tax=Niabella sp. TaxID=1962976 RepID=UPI00262E4296|nr:head GIN domain-containing protein [Niabella sp.]
MKQTLFLGFIAVLLTIAQSCKKVYPDGPAVKETRNVGAFGKVETTFSAHVEYRTGASKVEVLAADNIQHYVITEVVDDKLVIRTPNNVSIKRGSVTVYVTAPALTAVTLTGSGNFTAFDVLETGALELKLTGSGNITIDRLKAVSLKSQISGDGDLYINNGETSSQDVTITGSGNYNAHPMQSKEANVRITGSGNAKVWAKDQLNVTITGSGNLRYVGTPVIATSITGSGNVRAL